MCTGVGSSELYITANNTTPSEVTDSEGLAAADADPVVFGRGGNVGVRLRFAGSVYFLSCGAVACVAAACFVALRCCFCRPCQSAESKHTDAERQNVSTTNQQPRVSPASQTNVTTTTSASAADRPRTAKMSPTTSRKQDVATCGTSAAPAPPPTTTVTTVLDDGTERQSSVTFRRVEMPPPPPSQSVVRVKRASGGGVSNQRRRVTLAESPSSRPSDIEAPAVTPGPPDVGPVAAARNRRHVKPLRFRLKSIDTQPTGGRPKLFRLLIVIAVWTSAVTGGPLSSVTSYACYPAGSRWFVAGAVVADAVAALACAAAGRATAGRGDVSTIIAMSCLGTIVLVYYTALVLFSLHPQPHHHQLQTRSTEMPLFGSTAEMLAVSVDVTTSRQEGGYAVRSICLSVLLSVCPTG